MKVYKIRYGSDKNCERIYSFSLKKGIVHQPLDSEYAKGRYFFLDKGDIKFIREAIYNKDKAIVRIINVDKTKFKEFLREAKKASQLSKFADKQYNKARKLDNILDIEET